ncbi:hypothetical protein DFH28DRAFT_1174331 [Melampsora americana]|nr:hypothetical protein DFH28DRAFT_1174331 [Melampsora americana]
MSDNGSFNYEEAKNIADKLEDLTKLYENGDGSNGKSIAEVRSLYSQIVPYDKPNWYRNWSKFATDLIQSDKDHNRPIPKNECPTPTRPVESDKDPVYVFDMSANPTFPEDVVLEGRESIHGKEKNKRANTPTIHILTQEEIDMAQRARNLLDAENQREKRLSSHSKSSSPSISKRISRQRKSNKTDGDSDDSQESDGILTKKQKKNFNWSSRAESGPNSELSYTPGAIRFAHAKRGYATGIKDAVKGFNQTVRPSDFPKNLSKDGLEGEYIDLRRIKGEFMANKKGYAAPLTLDGRDKKLSLQNKVLSEKLLDAQEWFYYFDILQRTYQEAFPSCYQDFVKYSNFIKERFMSDGWKANWICVAEFDADLRRNFAEKENISFGDFDHPSLSTLPTQYMYKAYEPQQPEASTSSKPFQSSSRQRSNQRDTFQSKKWDSSPLRYNHLYKYKNGLGVEDTRNLPEPGTYCFSFNLGHCALGSKCSRMHRCNVRGCRKAHAGVDHT